MYKLFFGLKSNLIAAVVMLLCVGIITVLRLQHEVKTLGIFNVHAAKQLLNDPQLDNIFEKVQTVIKKSEFYKNSTTFNISLTHKKWEYTVYSPIDRTSFGITYGLFSQIIISPFNVSNDQFLPNDMQYSRTPTDVIAHEAVHMLIYQHYGIAAQFFPAWKSEGYSDYISPQSNMAAFYNLNDYCDEKLDKDAGSLYFQYWLAVSYLMDDKKMTGEQLFETDLSYKEVKKEVKMKRCPV